MLINVMEPAEYRLCDNLAVGPASSDLEDCRITGRPLTKRSMRHILGLIASYLTIEQTCLGALRTFCLSQPPPLLKPIGFEEPANSRVGRDRLQFALRLRQGGQIISMKLD